MLIKEPKKILTAFALSATLALAACGGGGGGGGSTASGNNDNEDPGTNPETSIGSESSNVEGPLDILQEPLSNQVFGALADGAASVPGVGEPLAGLVNCSSQLIVTDVLDILDSFLVLVDPTSLQNPQSLITDAAPQLQATFTEFAADLPGLLASLADGDCAMDSDAEPGSNPLNGTPLQPLGDALAPVLGGFGGGEMGIGSLSALVAQLSTAFSDGLASAYAADPTGQLSTAPVLSGVLETLDVALFDLLGTVAAIEDFDNPTGVASAVSTTLENLLNNVLIGVVPIGLIEEQSGQGPIISSQIESAVAALTGLLGGDFSGFTDGDFTQLFQSGITDLLSGLGGGEDSPLAGTPLAAIQDLIAGGLAGGFTGLPTTGTPLDTVLLPVTAVLEALMGFDSGPTGTPLDIILGPLAEGLGGSADAASCPLAATPLSALCSLTEGLLDGLALDDSNPLALLTDLLTSGPLAGLFGVLIPQS